MRVYVHVDANGTYQGNGGAVMLLGLAYQLGNMGYDVALFDPADRLRADMLRWVSYGDLPIAPVAAVFADDAPIVTTWLFSWLDVVESRPNIWPRLRYWCSGELLRAHPLHDAARAFVRAHIGTVAVCNPSLAHEYRKLSITPRWNWMNWVRDLFKPGDWEPGMIGYQPDQNGDVALDLLRQALNGHLVLCIGTQAEVAATMRRCDVFVSWNKFWPMTFGEGEAFGLTQYEAMASGCITLTRKHPANAFLSHDMLRFPSLPEVVALVDELARRNTPARRQEIVDQQMRMIESRLRFDKARAEHIQGYLERAS